MCTVPHNCIRITNYTFFQIGKLVLKIPWKNLYGSSVEATIEDLYLLVVPNNEVKYDAEKEEKLAFEAKQAEIARVELAKKKAAEKGLCTNQVLFKCLFFCI